MRWFANAKAIGERQARDREERFMADQARVTGLTIDEVRVWWEHDKKQRVIEALDTLAAQERHAKKEERQRRSGSDKQDRAPQTPARRRGVRRPEPEVVVCRRLGGQVRTASTERDDEGGEPVGSN